MVNPDPPLDDATRELLQVAPGDLDADGFYACRLITEGQMRGYWLALEPMTFGRVKLGISTIRNVSNAFKFGYADVWEFDNLEDARAAFETWNAEWYGTAATEPAKWRRHPLTGRRRGRDGQILLRRPEIPDALLAELRKAIAAGGAAHECEEWRVEFVDRCALCDKALPAIATEPERELTGDQAAAALLQFVVRGRDAQAAVDEAIEDATRNQAGQVIDRPNANDAGQRYMVPPPAKGGGDA